MAQEKIALVTGGNQGIGFEICKQLAQRGCVVLLGARNEIEGREAVSNLFKEVGQVEFQYIDLENPKTFDAVREHIERTYGRLDILVNNAAIALDGRHTVDTIPVGLVRNTFDINFFALMELTQVLLPLLLKSPAGRIVNQSSVLGSLTLHSASDQPLRDCPSFAYNASKTALNAYTIHLANALQHTNLKVNSAHPGSVKTRMNPEGVLAREEGAKTAVELALLDANGPTGGFFHLGQPLPW